MTKLPKYTVQHNERKGRWELEADKTGKVIKSTETKADMIKGGVLQDALGSSGGSVKIQKENGRFQEERTFPRSRDPKESKG